MGEFFCGWRRKLGCVTLVVACVATAGWGRSFSDTDIIEFYVGKNSTEVLYSFDCSVVWKRFHDEESHDEISFPMWDTCPQTDYAFFDDPKFDWNWRWAGFGVGACYTEAAVLWIVPYWSITVPLTLLSAYLILWPGKRKPPAEKPVTR
jgi:hypothetical protein